MSFPIVCDFIPSSLVDHSYIYSYGSTRKILHEPLGPVPLNYIVK